MIFFRRFFFRNVYRRRNRRSEGQTTYPWDNVDTVLVASSLSTSMCMGPGRNEIRARSATLVVCVAENSIVCRSTKLWF